MSITNSQFKSKKIEIAKKVLPYLLNPGAVSPVNLSVSEYALLYARDEKHVMTNWQFIKAEKTILSKVGKKLRDMGISRVSDFILK